jgi:hypothetical protein
MIVKDIVDKISTKKYYAEHELIRFFGSEELPYEDRVNGIISALREIDVCDKTFLLVDKYFDSKNVNKEPNQLEFDFKQ